MEQPTTETQRPPTLLVLVTTIAPGTDRLRLASLPPAEAQRVVDALLGRVSRRRAPRPARSGPVDWGLLTDLELQIAELRIFENPAGDGILIQAPNERGPAGAEGRALLKICTRGPYIWTSGSPRVCRISLLFLPSEPRYRTVAAASPD